MREAIQQGMPLHYQFTHIINTQTWSELYTMCRNHNIISELIRRIPAQISKNKSTQNALESITENIYNKILCRDSPYFKIWSNFNNKYHKEAETLRHSPTIKNVDIEIDQIHPKASPPSSLSLQFVCTLYLKGVTVKNIPKQLHKPVKWVELEFSEGIANDMISLPNST